MDFQSHFLQIFTQLNVSPYVRIGISTTTTRTTATYNEEM